MRFLKAIQKTQKESVLDVELTGDTGTAVQMDVSSDNNLPELLGREHLNIGGPNSAIRGRRSIPVERTSAASPTVDSAGSDLQVSEWPKEAPAPELFVDSATVNQHLVAVTQPQSIYTEEYRSLRTHILTKSQLEPLQSIVVVSLGTGEGKSVTAVNLSWLLAQTDGISALLIDCDLRMPSLTEYLGITAKTGLSDILDGGVELSDAVVRLRPSGLYLLPGGKARTDVAEMISGPTFAEILAEARGMFDYVIIDAPPLGIFTDATVLMNHADGALLVVKSGGTRYKDLDRVMQNLPRERMLGVVLNQSEETLIDNSYYDYPYYKKG